MRTHRLPTWFGRRFGVATCLLLVALSQAAWANQPWEPEIDTPRGKVAPQRSMLSWSVRPMVGYQFATTSYHINAIIDSTQGLNGSSQLDWPESAVVGGVKAHALWGGWGSLSVSFLTNIGNPIGTMLDRDWISNQSQSVEFSHTESDTHALVIAADVVGHFRLASLRYSDADLDVDVLAGYRHEYFTGDAFGLSGWQGNASLPTNLSFASDSKVGHYQHQRGLPNVGVGIHSRFLERLVMDTDVQFAVAISGDEDDHLLRNFVSQTLSGGIGLIAECSPRWVVYGAPDHGFSVGVGGSVQLRLMQTWGKWHQSYYAASGNTPAGTQGPDVDVTFTSALLGLRAMADIVF